MGTEFLRVIRRRASFEARTPIDECIKTEFWSVPDSRPDLNLSTYKVKSLRRKVLRALTIRVLTEHSASFLRAPDDILYEDLAGFAKINKTPGGTKFSFANKQHRELPLKSKKELIDLVIKPLQRRVSERSDKEDGPAVLETEVKAYAESQIQYRSPEWRSVHGKLKSGWNKFLNGVSPSILPMNEDKASFFLNLWRKALKLFFQRRSKINSKAPSIEEDGPESDLPR